MHVILVKEKYMHSSTYFPRRFLLVWWNFLLIGCVNPMSQSNILDWHQGTVVTREDFSVFLDIRRYKNWAHKIDSWKYLIVRLNTLTETTHPGQAPKEPFAWVILQQEGLERNAALTCRVPERSKGDTMCLTTSQNPSCWYPSWLSNACTTRKDSWVRRLAKNNVETNPTAIKPKTGSHKAQQFSWVPLPYCSLPRCPFQ